MCTIGSLELGPITVAIATGEEDLVRAREIHEQALPQFGPSRWDTLDFRHFHTVGIAWISGVMVGYALIDSDRTSACVMEIGVAPARQSEGIGTALLRWAAQTTRQNGLDTLRLTPLANDQHARLVSWYQRAGFTKTGDGGELRADPSTVIERLG